MGCFPTHDRLPNEPCHVRFRTVSCRAFMTEKCMRGETQMRHWAGQQVPWVCGGVAGTGRRSPRRRALRRRLRFASIETDPNATELRWIEPQLRQTYDTARGLMELFAD